VFVCFLLQGVTGHAALVNPIPWNPNPSQTAPCGGVVKSAPLTTLARNSDVNIVWNVIAGDGIGPVMLTFDATGGADPTGTPVTIGTTSHWYSHFHVQNS